MSGTTQERSNTSHTSGPWHVNSNGPAPIIYDASGYAIADATTFHGKHREGEASHDHT